MRILSPIVTVCLLLAAGVAAANDNQVVYESISEISIGRVFLSASERASLDARRNAPRQFRHIASHQAKPVAIRRPSSLAAGFIVNASGTPSRWHDGDFVDSSDASVTTMRFPGDIDIVRHVVESTDSAANSESAEDATTKAAEDSGDD